MATLGEILKAQREHLGLSLEQAEEATRIRGRLLGMLENDDYDHLPNPGYVKGYVASYAKYLELDPIEMTDLYRRQVGNMHVHEINVGAEPVVAPTREEHELPWRTALVAVAVIALAALVVWGVARLVRPSESPVPVPPAASSTSATSTAKPKAKTKKSKPKASTQTSAAAETSSTSTASGGNASGKAQTFQLSVAVKDTQRSWLRITVDGTVEYEGVLAGPASKEYRVKNVAKVRIGAPGGVEILRDGTTVEIPNGTIPTVTLRADKP